MLFTYWIHTEKLEFEAGKYTDNSVDMILDDAFVKFLKLGVFDDPLVLDGHFPKKGFTYKFKERTLLIKDEESYRSLLGEYRVFFEYLSKVDRRLERRKTVEKDRKQEKQEESKELSKEFTNPITFRFLTEDGDPIQGTFTLHQYKNGRYFENWHRYLPLDAKGEITIKEFPPEFQFGGSSKDDFYRYWIRSALLDPTKDTFVHRCRPTGAMKFEIVKFPKKYHDSLIVEYHRKLDDGSHTLAKGIGIFPDDPEHTIGGLVPGEYFIAIKFEYEDERPIFKSKQFVIKVKEYSTLPKIEITEAAIEASKR
jgi:hypothetical protein